MVITSKDNEFVKHVKKLKEKKYRRSYFRRSCYKANCNL